jgi:hypothetical protein
VFSGVARLTWDPKSPTTVGDIIPPLEGCTLYKIDGDSLVLHGREQPMHMPPRHHLGSRRLGGESGSLCDERSVAKLRQ